MYYVSDYCSLNCLVCDLKHAWDKKHYGKLREILGKIRD
jgi:organic radical activating enzyme